MSDQTQGGGARRVPWRIIGWGGAAALLLVPLVARAPWTLSDFIFAGLVFGVTGLLLELAARVSRNNAYRAGVVTALAAAFLIVWANGAVGMIGNEDNRYNLLFFGVIALALAGTVATGFRAAGMALAMAAAALAQISIALGGLAADERGAIYSMLFSGLWILSAALFRKAARDESAANAAH